MVGERTAPGRRLGWSFCPSVTETIETSGGKGCHVIIQELIRLWSLKGQRTMLKKGSGPCVPLRLHLSLIRGLSRQLERGIHSSNVVKGLEHAFFCIFAFEVLKEF